MQKARAGDIAATPDVGSFTLGQVSRYILVELYKRSLRRFSNR
jgi:hypothetical protein